MARHTIAGHKKPLGKRATERQQILRAQRAHHITLWRETSGVSQTELAETLGVSARTVQRWESREVNVPNYVMLALEALDRRYAVVEIES